MADPKVASEVHDALRGYLEDGEIAVHWAVTIDICRPDGGRYLAHRYGGGIDGNDSPMAWVALGMLQAGADGARDQLREGSTDVEDVEDQEDGD
jgi:hypothetical protein